MGTKNMLNRSDLDCFLESGRMRAQSEYCIVGSGESQSISNRDAEENLEA